MAWGGPYTLEIKGKENALAFENVLVGDVWLCSGQSNMEWTVKASADAPREMAAADYPMIRSYNLVKAIEYTPVDDVQGEWEVCSPATAGDFSAVGYFFARKLHEETGIPIGIINSSWGGTDIETWTSMDAFLKLGDHYMERYANVDMDGFEAFRQRNDEQKRLYEEALRNDAGMAGKWQEPDTDISGWKKWVFPDYGAAPSWGMWTARCGSAVI